MIMWCSCSCPPAATASRARRAGRRCASRARPRTAPARCCPGPGGCTAPTAHPVNHHLGVSAFADYATVSRRSLVKIDPELPLDEAALFGCAVLTGVGAVVNTAQVPAGASAAVIGLGGVGLSSLLGAVAAGARRDRRHRPGRAKAGLRSRARRHRHLQRHATRTPRAGQSCHRRRGRIRFRAGRLPAALELAFKITRRGGTTVTAGLPPPTATLPCSPVTLVAEERTLKGSYIGTAVPSRDIPRYIALYQRGRLPVDRLMSGTLKLDEINEGFDRLHDGRPSDRSYCCEDARDERRPWEDMTSRWTRAVQPAGRSWRKSWFDGQTELANTLSCRDSVGEGSDMTRADAARHGRAVALVDGARRVLGRHARVCARRGHRRGNPRTDHSTRCRMSLDGRRPGRRDDPPDDRRTPLRRHRRNRAPDGQADGAVDVGADRGPQLRGRSSPVPG